MLPSEEHMVAGGYTIDHARAEDLPGVVERLAAAEAGLKASGCSRVTLDTTQPLERAIRFYTRHGYAPTGTVSDFFGMPLYEYAKGL